MSDDAKDNDDAMRGRKRWGVDINVTVNSEADFYAGKAENLSEGGLFIATHIVPPIGTRFQLSLHLEDDNDSVVRGAGEVRWLRASNHDPDAPAGIGIRFLKLENDGQARVNHYLEVRRAQAAERGEELIETRFSAPPSSPAPGLAVAPPPLTGEASPPTTAWGVGSPPPSSETSSSRLVPPAGTPPPGVPAAELPESTRPKRRQSTTDRFAQLASPPPTRAYDGDLRAVARPPRSETAPEESDGPSTGSYDRTLLHGLVGSPLLESDPGIVEEHTVDMGIPLTDSRREAPRPSYFGDEPAPPTQSYPGYDVDDEEAP
ncbi:MAG: PilZ domain-containing protein [Myxococcota bacterium]